MGSSVVACLEQRRNGFSVERKATMRVMCELQKETMRGDAMSEEWEGGHGGILVANYVESNGAWRTLHAMPLPFFYKRRLARSSTSRHGALHLYRLSTAYFSRLCQFGIVFYVVPYDVKCVVSVRRAAPRRERTHLQEVLHFPDPPRAFFELGMRMGDDGRARRGELDGKRKARERESYIQKMGTCKTHGASGR